LLVPGFQQEGIKSATAFHRLQRMCADPQAHLALQRVTDQRHVAQIWPERALGLVLGVAAQLSRHRQLARQLALARHFEWLLASLASRIFRETELAGRSIREGHSVKTSQPFRVPMRSQFEQFFYL